MKLRRALLAFALLTTMLGCTPGHEKTVPEDLLGVWTTSEPKYADRFFELAKDAIIFGTGGDDFDVYPVESVERTRDEEGLVYNIRYLNREGQPYTFSIYYDASHHGVIRLKHQKHFHWTREER